MNAVRPQIAMFCDLLLVGCAFQITREQAVPRVISFYQIQAWLLILSVSLNVPVQLTDLVQSGSIWPILVVTLLQLLLISSIRPLLARATLGPDAGASGLIALLRYLVLPSARRRLLALAEPEWIQRIPATTRRGVVLGVLGMILSLACVLALHIRDDSVEMSSWFGMAVSLTVCLVGLYNLTIRRDIITQVVGLLVMDHGLLLGVFDSLKHTVLRVLFVGGIAFYTLITLYILVDLLPRVRREGGSIRLDTLSKGSKLRG